MNYSIDLHTHSSMSDGILNPEELVSRANSAGVEVLALTDHDTVAGVERAAAAASEVGIQLIPAIELSAEWNGIGIHVVGLHIDIHSPLLQAALARQAAARQERAEKIAQRLEKQGVEGALAGAQRFADGAVITRPHFASYLIEAGYVRSSQEAFKRYLGTGKSGDIKQAWPELDVVIDWITRSGGMAVLAHPIHYGMTNAKLRRLLTDFCAFGGTAMEVISGRQTDQQTQHMARLAEEFKLYASAGSDFHNPEFPWQSLGAFGTLPASCTLVPLSNPSLLI